MGPTPLLATHVLYIKYTIGGVTHSVSPFVKAEATGTPGEYDLISCLGGSAPVQTIVDDFKAAFGPVCAVGTTPAGWVLYRYVGPDLDPIQEGTYTLTPGAYDVYEGWQNTLIGRDSDRKIVKFVMPEVVANNFAHWGTVAAIPAGGHHDFAASWMSQAPENWSTFFRNRNDKNVTIFKGLTWAGNRYWRRRRGLT
jgi:hypothetical protein